MSKSIWAIELPPLPDDIELPDNPSVADVIDLLIDRPELMLYTRMFDPVGWERDFMGPARRRRAKAAKRS
jgi:hypothetical protein